MAEKQPIENVAKAKQDGSKNAPQPQPQPQPQQAQEQQAQQQATQMPQTPQTSRQQEQKALLTESMGTPQELALAPTYVSPFTLMRRMAEEMDSVFEEFGFPRASSLLSPFTEPGRGRTPPTEGLLARNWIPQVEVFERDGELVVRVDLPGMAADDVRLTVTDDAITVEGERHYQHEERGEEVYQSELTYGSFFRVIPLPKGIDTETVAANLDNGVLQISMKAPSAKRISGRKVQVKAAGAASAGLTEAAQKQSEPEARRKG